MPRPRLPENQAEWPAASILELRNDARFLVAVLEELARVRPIDARLIIETGVCDGGSSYQILTSDPHAFLLSFTFEGSRGPGEPENRQAPGSIAEIEDAKYAGRWARERLSKLQRSRWVMVDADSTRTPWLPEIEKAKREWIKRGGEYLTRKLNAPDLILLDGSHAMADVYAELAHLDGVPKHPWTVLLVHDADQEGVRAAVKDWSEQRGIPSVWVPGTKWLMARPGALWTLAPVG